MYFFRQAAASSFSALRKIARNGGSHNACPLAVTRADGAARRCPDGAAQSRPPPAGPIGDRRGRDTDRTRRFRCRRRRPDRLRPGYQPAARRGRARPVGAHRRGPRHHDGPRLLRWLGRGALCGNLCRRRGAPGRLHGVACRHSRGGAVARSGRQPGAIRFGLDRHQPRAAQAAAVLSRSRAGAAGGAQEVRPAPRERRQRQHGQRR